MKVRDLIASLHEHDPDLIVVSTKGKPFKYSRTVIKGDPDEARVQDATIVGVGNKKTVDEARAIRVVVIG